MRTHSTTTGTSDDGFRRLEVSTGVGRRRRWTDEEKAWIEAESLHPATTTSAVARCYGLHVDRGAHRASVWGPSTIAALRASRRRRQAERSTMAAVSARLGGIGPHW